MADLENVTNATERVEQAKRLIREAQSARQPNELPVRTSRDEIDRTRRASEAMANLAQLIDGITAAGPRE
jgi:hypothetical protein